MWGIPERLLTVTMGCKSHPLAAAADDGVVGVVGVVGDVGVDDARADGFAGCLHAEHGQATGPAVLLDLGGTLLGASLLECVVHGYPLRVDRVRYALKNVNGGSVVVPTEPLAGQPAVLGQVDQAARGIAGPGEGDHILDPRRGQGVESLEVVDHEGGLTLGRDDQSDRCPRRQCLVPGNPADRRQIGAEQIVEPGVRDHPLDLAVATPILLHREGETEQIPADGVDMGRRPEHLVAFAISHDRTSSLARGRL